MHLILLLFFFASRRRHTRWPRDWSSDVCSSDLSSELVMALESSWSIVERCLERWTSPMLGDVYTREIGGTTQEHTRQAVLMRLITHDAYHTGEISQTLVAHGQPEIDLWRPSPA